MLFAYTLQGKVIHCLYGRGGGGKVRRLAVAMDRLPLWYTELIIDMIHRARYYTWKVD